MEAIVYQIDENGNRIEGTPNWKGHFHEDSSENNMWMYIEDTNGGIPQIEKGMRIRYSSTYRNADYIILDARNQGIYQVKKL